MNIFINACLGSVLTLVSVIELLGIKSTLGRKRLMAAMSQLISSDVASSTQAKIANRDGNVEVGTLPPGKRYHYFGELGIFSYTYVLCYSYLGSHKKEHSVSCFLFSCIRHH